MRHFSKFLFKVKEMEGDIEKLEIEQFCYIRKIQKKTQNLHKSWNQEENAIELIFKNFVFLWKIMKIIAIV